MNCIINAVTEMNKICEAKSNRRDDKTQAFAKLFDNIISGNGACMPKNALNRIQPIGKMVTAKHETEDNKPAESIEAQETIPVVTEETVTWDRTENAEDSQSRADLNHEIVRTLSEMLFIPPERILTALVDMNIQPVMLQDQAVLEDFLAQVQAIEPFTPQMSIQADNMTLPNILLEAPVSSELSEITFETPVNDQTLTTVMENEAQQSAGPIMTAVIGPEQLADAISRIIQKETRTTQAASLETSNTKETWAPEITTAESNEVILDTDYSDNGQEEDIGESWHSTDFDDSIVFNKKPEKSEASAQPFILPQSETQAAPIEANITNAADAIRLEAGKNTIPNEIIRQVTDGIKAESLGGGLSELRMTLKPESLGEVSLKLLSDNGIITARFTAENQRVKEIMESNFNNLRDSLSEHGINVNQLSVSVGQRQDTQDRRFIYQARRAQSRALTSIEDAPAVMSTLAAHDSRVSFTA